MTRRLAIALVLVLLLAAPAGGRVAPDPCTAETLKAVEWMQYARNTHVWWRDYGGAYPEDVRKWVGEPELHRLWVDRYNVVIDELLDGCRPGG